jgi:hypothetical protein
MTNAEPVVGRRLWAVLMLAHTPEVAESVLIGRAVMAAGLDAEAMRRALRGGPLPDPDQYVVVTDEMLDAINEAGPLRPTPRRRGR